MGIIGFVRYCPNMRHDCNKEYKIDGRSNLFFGGLTGYHIKNWVGSINQDKEINSNWNKIWGLDISHKLTPLFHAKLTPYS